LRGFSQACLCVLFAGMVRAPAVQAQSARDVAGQPDKVELTVPLIWRGRILNEVFVRLDQHGNFEIDSASFSNQLRPVLNYEGRQVLEAALSGRDYVDADTLKQFGILVSFDMGRLSLVLDAIDPVLIPSERLVSAAQREQAQPTLEPAGFSAYLNANAAATYREGSDMRPPEIFLDGAMRFGGVVLEYEGLFSELASDEYSFSRQSLRGVYDQPEAFRRFSIGDLQVPGSQLVNSPFIGGISVQKSRRLFDPFYAPGTFSGRQVTISSPSTLDILINGAPYQSLELQPGRYDLDDLPIEYGSNNVELVVRDAAGRISVSDFSLFFDPVELLAGEDEYMAAFGYVADGISFEPDYSDELAFVADYRRALNGSFLLGGGVQISDAVQVASAEMQIVPQVIPGSLRLSAATSNSEEASGFAAFGGYRWYGGDTAGRKSASVTVDYRGANFESVGDLASLDSEQLTINATYSQGLSDRTFVTLGGNYLNTGLQDSRYSAYADVTHRLTPALGLKAGVEYGTDSQFGNEFGVRLGLTMAFAGRQRADLNYQSRRNYARASVSKAREDEIGAFGYSLAVQQVQDDQSIDGAIDYLGNRFDSRLSLISQGPNISEIGESQTARFQFGTSFAFADGGFGIGRPIRDSFAVLNPHRTMESDLIAGRSLAGGSYEASSGLFGGAVLNRLNSYNAQEFQYDLKSGEAGYDIGAGVERVFPPYKSGYSHQVGSDRFVSAVGFLYIGEEIGSLMTGRITEIDDDGFEPQPFFTNSSGRFGIIGLAPGKHYRVKLANGAEFEISVPADNSGLLRLGNIATESGDEGL